MAAKANVIGIIVQPGGTVLVGRESTVADDGVAGINLRGYVSASFIQTANDSSANYHANASGSNTSSSKESYTKTTGYNAGNYNMQLYNGAMDTAGVLKYIIAHSAADKKVMIADDDLSDITFDTGTTSILDSTISTPSAITIGKNGSAANTVVDVSSSNHTIRCGQGMNFYNGGTLLARASTLYLGTSSSSPYAGENSSRWGINLSVGKIGGASTSAAPTGTWYVSSIRSTISSNTLRFTTGTCTITGKNTSANRFFEITDGNVYHSNGTLTIDSGVSAEMQWDAASTDQDNGPYNFIINDASCTARIRTALEVLNDMTVTAGTFNTHSNDGGADKNLAITGECIVEGGTLTLNGSTVDVGDMKITSGTVNGNTATIDLNTGGGDGWAWFHSGGTWNYNTSTVVYKANGKHMEGEFYNLTIECGASNHTGVWRADGIASSIMKCANNLTVKEGIWKRDSASETMTIDGDVLIESGGTLGQLGGDTGPNNFGGLKLSSGSAYVATSGTTTITNRFTGESHLWKNDGGTYTHNNGTVRFTDNDHSSIKENTFYNVEIASANANQYAVNFEAQGGGGNAFTILGDLTIESGDFELINADDTLDIHGQTIIDNALAGGSPNNTYARFNNDKNQTGTITHHGLVTVKSGTYHVEDGATVNMVGIRNIGGLID